jgi:hypothetical protein
MINPLPRHPTFFHQGENAEQNAIFVNGGEGGGWGGAGKAMTAEPHATMNRNYATNGS